MASIRERDQEYIRKAEQQVSASVLVIPLLNNKSQKQKVLFQLSLNILTWGKSYNEIISLMNEERWVEVEENITLLLEDYDRFKQQFAKHLVPADPAQQCIGIHLESELYCHRSRARGVLENYDEAIQDASNALVLYRSCVVASYGSTCEDQKEILKRRDFALLLRSSFYNLTEDYEKSRVDLRARLANFRSFADNRSLFQDVELKNRMQTTVELLLNWMKIEKKGYPRPHYSKEERLVLHEDLSLDWFMKCDNCDKDKSMNGVKLSRCVGCEASFYCTNECQRKAWKEHNKNCGMIICLDDRVRAELVTHRETPHFITTTKGKRVLAQWDPTTNRYFDSIADRDVYFVPSERTLVDKVVKEQREQRRNASK